MSVRTPHGDLAAIYRAAVERVDPFAMIGERLALSGSRLSAVGDRDRCELDLDAYSSLFVVGAGKGGARMAAAIEALLGDRITDGVVAVPRGSGAPLDRIRLVEAGHPVPDEGSLRAAREIAELCDRADERTLCISLISGGGSALLCLPRMPLTLAEKQEVTRQLLVSGATIQELNTVRKHLSAIKGGQLARLFSPAVSLNLMLSDVVGDRLDVIASGLTVPDPTTYEQAIRILDDYGILERAPAARRLLERGSSGTIPETPKPGDPLFERVHNLLVGSNSLALRAAEQRARELGYHTLVLSSQIVGEARDAARALIAIAKEIARYDLPCPKPACLLAGGETTVSVRGGGRGGRNQEMALSALIQMDDDPDATRGIAALFAGSDGIDGPTPAAGAFASRDVLEAARALPRDRDMRAALGRNDSYHFFNSMHYLFEPGATGTNVGDLYLIIIE